MSIPPIHNPRPGLATDAVVDVRDVHYAIGGRPIFAGLNLTVRRGRITAIMGPSGTGKTTLLRLITGQISPDQGQVLTFGQDVARLRGRELYALRQRLGMLFQNGALLTDLDVFENVAFPVREHTDLPESLIRKLVLTKLQSVGLRGAAELMPAELSGGMARRVALARASATRRAMPPESSAGIRSVAPRKPTASNFVSTSVRTRDSGRSVCSRTGNATFSNTLMSVSSAPFWNNMPMRLRTA